MSDDLRVASHRTYDAAVPGRLSSAPLVLQRAYPDPVASPSALTPSFLSFVLACGPVVTSDDDTGSSSDASSSSSTTASTSASTTVGSSTSTTVGTTTVGSSTGPLDTGDVVTTNDDAPPPFCGDGVLQPDSAEQCDGEDLGGFDCQALGLGNGGQLACSDECTFVTDDCSLCGNGSIDPGEQCEGDDLQGFDCESLGLGGGVLVCADNCTFETRGCGLDCGDGVVSPGEQCDGMNLQGFTCESLGLSGGTLACDPTTCTFDTSMCEP